MSIKVAGVNDVNGKIKVTATLISDLNVWRSGTTIPSNLLGDDGDFFVNSVTLFVYEKVSGSYVNRGGFNGGGSGVSRITFNQTNFTVPPGVTFISQVGSFSVPGTSLLVTLPLANSLPAGYTITLVDESGNIGSFNGQLNFTVPVGNTVSGLAPSNGSVLESFQPSFAYSDGVSKWYIYSLTEYVSVSGNSSSSGFIIGPRTANISGNFLNLTDGRGFVISAANDQEGNGALVLYGQKGIRLPYSTTIQRPQNPAPGIILYNQDTLKSEFFENGVWNNLIPASSILPKVTVFETSGTFTKETTSKVVIVKMLGGGGGGGSGGRGLTTVIRTGGGGGAGGSYSERSYNAVDLSANETVVVGAAGSGGLGQVTDSALGNNGVAGGFSSFSTLGNLLRAQGGAAGGQGRITGVAAAGGAVGAGNIFNGSQGGASSATGVAGAAGTIANQFAAAGGGAGGGLTAANGAAAGGAGGAGAFMLGSIAGGTAGAAGANGNSSTATLTGTAKGSPGSGGGGATPAGAGGAGGISAKYGAGGGGGGASSNTFVSGTGGNGGNGVVVVYEW